MLYNKKSKKKWTLSNGKTIIIDDTLNENILLARLKELKISILSEEILEG